MGLMALGPGCSCCSFCSTSYQTDFADDFASTLSSAWLGYFTRSDWTIASGHLRFNKTPVWPDFQPPQTQGFLYQRCKVGGTTSTVRIGATLKALRTDTVTGWEYKQRIGIGWSILEPGGLVNPFTGINGGSTFFCAESYQNKDGLSSADGTRYILLSDMVTVVVPSVTPAIDDQLEIELTNFRSIGSALPNIAVCDLAAKVNGTTVYSRSPWYGGFPMCKACVGCYGLEYWTQFTGSAGTKAELDDFYYSGV